VTAPGLEAITAAELNALGLTPGRFERGGVSFEADASGLYRANLRLRTASRVLVRLASFRATAFYELEKRIRKVPWETILPPGTPAEFRVTSRESKLYHGRAVADRLAGWVGATAGAGSTDVPVQEFVVRIVSDRVTISADSSGALLHQRGYRLATAKAPLRETLAAAILLGAGWDGRAPLLDPMCGAGTIPIEAALIARRLAPGRHRRFAFMTWPTFDATAWDHEVATADSEALPRAPGPILGSDRDVGAIRAATENAARAGVATDIEFAQTALSAIEPPAGPGWLVTNPPYGVRVGEANRLRDLFAKLGQVVRAKCPAWQVAMLSANRMLEGQTGLEFGEVFRTSNGGIPVRLVMAGLPA
jgi:putative N6-adenine-specific DNA methylase